MKTISVLSSMVPSPSSPPQLRGELCDLLRVQLMDHDAVLFFRFAVGLFSVAEAVKIRQPQFREFPESLPPRTGSYRDHIGQAGDQCGPAISNCALRTSEEVVL